MKTDIDRIVALNDVEPSQASFEAEFLAGLTQFPKALPCKFLYDERGSRLFNRICELPEYYSARTEMGILRDNIHSIAALCGHNFLLVEPGSGSGAKTRLLLENLQLPVAYIPIDISRARLLKTAESLCRDYVDLEVIPVCADYNRPLTLPSPSRPPERAIVFFPGSTIGNFEPWQASGFLRRIGDWCEPGDGLLIGVDLLKDRELLRRAYNDQQGVTAAFNMNILQRANAELGADFDLSGFRHEAIFNEEHGRIEMHLISRRRQQVCLADKVIHFDCEESIVTEYSYKYRPEDFRVLAASAGWKTVQTWTDKRELFSVHFLKLENNWR